MSDMSAKDSASGGPLVEQNSAPKEITRRQFLHVSGGAMGVVGAGFLAWPFIKSMNPAADVLALSTVEVNLKPIHVGHALTVFCQGKPVFIRHRTVEEIRAARDVEIGGLPDPQSDEERVKKEQWLVVVGVCTHLGCIPMGQKVADNKGEFGGWFCPCHGSHYDSSGRIRKGPAASNLAIPKYEFISDDSIRIG